jgi:hypothetical protein
MNQDWRGDAFKLVIALVSVAAITAGFRLGLHLRNPTTAALPFLLIVWVTAAVSRPAAEHGRIWGENCRDSGAQFTIVVQAESAADHG